MRATKFLINTLKETPADAAVISHQLMLRSGMIRKLAAGLYSWQPLGLRVLRKAEKIIREEMDLAGALELVMPVVQPTELWEESGRLGQFGLELLRFKDRHNREFCLGPTHEEVITDIARNELKSYKQLPVSFYQIQTKFRDEVRPRFGVMRSREFIMKDAYSFHIDQASLQQTYDEMHEVYSRIFTRMDLDFRSVAADTGSIGGSASREFHVLAQSGEDLIAVSDSSDYAANVEMAEALAPEQPRPEPSDEMQSVATPGQKTIAQVSSFLQIQKTQLIKTLLVHGETEGDANTLVALILRGDHTLNEIKAEKLPQVLSPLTFASDQEIQSLLHCNPGSLGPVGLSIPVLVDHSAAALADFACGANRDDQHMTGVNWDRDCSITQVADLRNVEAGDPSPDGKGNLILKRGIEVGHIFQLGNKYAQAMNATVLTEHGKAQVMTMGCYGIGVTRVVAAAIEQNHDKRGIIWPNGLTPFQIGIIPLNYEKSPLVRETADRIYEELIALGYEVFLDDRDKKVSTGVKFADMELIGIPHQLIIGDRGLKEGVLEYQERRSAEKIDIKMESVIEYICSLLSPT